VSLRALRFWRPGRPVGYPGSLSPRPVPKRTSHRKWASGPGPGPIPGYRPGYGRSVTNHGAGWPRQAGCRAAVARRQASPGPPRHRVRLRPPFPRVADRSARREFVHSSTGPSRSRTAMRGSGSGRSGRTGRPRPPWRGSSRPLEECPADLVLDHPRGDLGRGLPQTVCHLKAPGGPAEDLQGRQPDLVSEPPVGA